MRGAHRRVLHASRGTIISSRNEATLTLPPPLLSLLFVRHGETTANRDGVLQGHQNYNLTNLGERQAKVTGERLSRKKFWQVHSSDLVRASRTAEIILEAHPGLDLRTSPLLREFSLGVLEDLPRGTSREEALRIKAGRAGVPVDEFQAPRSETIADLERRAQQFLDSLLDEARRGRTRDTAERSVPVGNPGPGDEVPVALIVSHGGFIHTMLSRVFGLGKDVPLPSNCSISIVDVHELGTGDGREGRTRGGVSYVPQVLDDNAHMVEAGLAVVNRVENLDVYSK